MSQVIDNTARSRFELEENGLVAFADYRLNGQQMVIPHVEAPIELRGTGVAGRLMEGVLTAASEAGLKVVPSCPYADAYIRRHKQWENLRA